MMLISALQTDPRLKDRLSHGLNIRWLETTIEKAWSEGYDLIGAKQLNHKLKGTSKWIGTTEIYVLLTYLGVKCSIFDFPSPDSKTGLHTALVNWIIDYFAVNSNQEIMEKVDSAKKGNLDQSLVLCNDRWPIYLQHSGHSRTVVGIELHKDSEPALLVFDPGRSIPMRLKEFAVEVAQSGLSAELSSERDSSEGSFRKRVQGKDTSVGTARGDDAGVQSSSSEANVNSELVIGKSNKFSKYLNRAFPVDPRLLSAFRANLKLLSKNPEYQCLRIEPELLLTPDEQLARKSVKSLVVR